MARRLDDDAIWALQARIDAIPYDGLGLGAALTDQLVLCFAHGARLPGWRSRVVDALKLARHRACGVQHQVPAVLPPAGRHLLTWIEDRPHLTDLVMPIVRELGPGACSVLALGDEHRTEAPAGVILLDRWQVAPAPIPQWRRRYSACAPGWRRATAEWLRSYALSPAWGVGIEDALLATSQWVESFRLMLRAAPPRTVITEASRHYLAAPLLIAARELGIPSVGLVHGVMSPVSAFAPLACDSICCWGADNRDVLTAAGVASERIRITGCPRLTQDLSYTAVEARTALGYPPGNPVVTLATSPVAADDRRRLLGEFGRATAQMPGWTASVRLHPAEVTDFYAPELGNYPQLRIVPARSTPLDVSVAASTAFVVNDSGAGNDALMKRVPVFVLDVLGELPANGTSLVRDAGCVAARSAADLVSGVLRLTTDRSFAEGLAEMADRYVRRFCARFGDEATRAIADVVRSASL